MPLKSPSKGRHLGVAKCGVETFHPHLHGILADGYWKGDVFTRFPEIDIAALNRAFTERVLALLHKQELISDDDVVQILSQDHTGFLSMDE